MSTSEMQTIEVQLGVKIPLRDGIHLIGTRYKPKSQNRAAPCIMALTPYASDSCHEYAAYFARRGLPFIVVDCRGRGNSEGEFQPLIQEAKDGYDVVEWLASQPYCNGKVGMWGGSYVGYDQWATAKEAPVHLSTIVPSASVAPGIDFPMRNNIFQPYAVQWLALTRGRASQFQLFRDSKIWSDIYSGWHTSGRPFRELNAFAGQESKIFQTWLAHPEPDEFWDQHCPTAEENTRLEIPILTITGIYDDDQPGALWHYQQHMRSASAEARARHYLVVGPWDHLAACGNRRAEFGGLQVGEEGLLDLSRLHLEWYSWAMLDGPKPEFLKKQVAYYVMGAERWQYADTLEEATERYEPLFLDSPGNADDVFRSGSLERRPGRGPPDTYRYNPGECNGPEVEAEARASGGSLVDQSLTFALRGKQLIYHSAPFERDTEICGFFKLSVWIAIDCPDTDFYVSVHEIGLDGSSIRLSTDALRARYREGLRTPKLIDTKGPLHYDFERFTFIARQIKRGHRLRLIIAPIGRIVEATFVQKNYNGGGVVAEESQSDAKPVTVRVFHDEAHPSALYAPIGRGYSKEEPPATG
jgi:putative CocE/NonD family hydrolase